MLSSPIPSTSSTSFSLIDSESLLTVLLVGNWSISGLHLIEQNFIPSVFSARRQVIFDLQGVAIFDTAGALVVNCVVKALQKKDITVSFAHCKNEYISLLKTASVPKEEEKSLSSSEPWFISLVTNLGAFIHSQFTTGGQYIGFLGKYCSNIVKLILQPQQVRLTPLIFHMEQAGLRAVPIVALLTFLIGMVVAYMGSEELARFGAQVFAVNLLEVTIMREMGVLITTIVVAGRSSSSFTAQIGAMVANEEVAAIRSMGLSPMQLLVIPRVMALTLMLPVLVFIADIMALLGGATALWYTMDMSLYAFTVQLQSVCKLSNFLVGMVKTPFFAVVIGIVGCLQGFKATSSAESVGFLTTTSVVQSIFLVIVLDALFAIFFTSLGI